jgi:deazaflavin-dependent oxidoreductase (nitroreductase family)
LFRNRIRAFNKRFLNPLILKFAGFSRNSFAVIRHVGRRSGKSYETPIIVKQVGDQFVIALTYGPEVDWYRNIQAAGHCTLLWQGRVYNLEKPEPIAVQAGLQAFPPPQNLILRLVGIQHFVSMKYQEVGRASETAKA